MGLDANGSLDIMYIIYKYVLTSDSPNKHTHHITFFLKDVVIIPAFSQVYKEVLDYQNNLSSSQPKRCRLGRPGESINPRHQAKESPMASGV